MPSTVIRHFAYDADQRILTILFVSGKQYRYLDVPAEVFIDFQSAFAKGIYYNQHIKSKFSVGQWPGAKSDEDSQ